MESIANPWLWAAFFSVVIIMLAIDLFWVGGGKQHKVSVKEAAIWSGIWVSVSIPNILSLLYCRFFLP